jgi:hypothetical protein
MGPPCLAATIAVVALLVVACGGGTFTAGADACPEERGDFPSYAFECSEDGRSIVACKGDAGQPSTCEQASRRATACSCDDLTACMSSTLAVACTKAAAAPVAGARPGTPQ